MILTEIKHYIMEHKQVSLTDLALHFETDPEIMKDMLEHWIRKGRVEKVEISSCSGCSCCKGCGGPDMEIYRWNI